MPSSSTYHNKHRTNYSRKLSQSPQYTTQHGTAHDKSAPPTSLLLDLPTESLTHITAFLDPSSLFALARTSKRFHEHVGDDNTWRRAFFCQFLDVSPEDDIQDRRSADVPQAALGKVLMLRREELTWKKEFVRRWNLRRRWEYTRSSSTISHVPVQSSVAEIHLMAPASPLPSAPTLLSASLAYGIVARSQPLTGKIAKGFLDAAGTRNGLGIGNPNAEFSPNISQCVITSVGETAKILWAFTNGAVAVTVAPRAMDVTRSPQAHWLKCSDQDAHVGSIEHAMWVDAPEPSSTRFFATAGSDGCVKVWDAESVKCVWTSPEKLLWLVRDRCMRVAVDAVHGVIAALFESGEGAVWYQLHSLFSSPDIYSTATSGPVKSVPIPPAVAYRYHGLGPRHILSTSIYCDTPNIVSVLTAYAQEAYFTKTTVDLNTGNMDHVAFGCELLGEITALQTSLPSGHMLSERGFVIVGDVFGYISIMAWDDVATSTPPTSSAMAPTSSVAPIHRFLAFDGASVSALHWNTSTLTVGSVFGSLKVFDATTFDLLRDFKLPFVRTLVDDRISHVAVVRDVLVATVGERVYAWRGEPPGNVKAGRGKRLIRTPHAVAKWHQQVELYRDIAESRHEMEDEQTYMRRAFGREREQQSTLENLGLSEVEAVEYVLMLSRDEEQRSQLQLPSGGLPDGVFAGEFDEDIMTPVLTPSAFLEGSSKRSTQSPSMSPRWSTPRTPPSLVGTSKIQISPRLQPEPIEAGLLDNGTPRSLSLSSSYRNSNSSLSLEDQSQFPSMSPPVIRPSVSGSPESVRSAWHTPLRSSRSSEGPSSPCGPRSIASSPAARDDAPVVSLLTAQFAQTSTNGGERQLDDGDEDLRFAIELSLAEARSRGELV
ncbi:hypothetical protein BDW22DRAFT_1361512 [Trametopsis cervina]|nr:hypothetical protein BDW22DRAFT_1361512 [Trametopsis cervina]